MNTIQLRGTVELTAAGDGPKRFSMTAYSGGLMRLAGFGSPVIVDASGLKVPSQSIAILRDHSPEKIVGHSDKIDVAKTGEISAAGVLSGSNAHAAEVLESSRSGFPWQASIGAAVERTEYVEAGSKITVNGRSVQGPAVVVRAATLREISFVAIGADGATSATVAASGSNGGKVMDKFQEWLTASGFEVESMTEQQKASLEATYKESLEAKRLRDLEATRAQRPVVTTSRQRDDAPDEGRILEAGLLCGLGMNEKAIGKHFDQNVMNEAVRPQNRSIGLQGLLRRVIRAAGEHAPEGRLTDSGIRTAFEASRKLEASGFSTISIPGILSNSATKMMLQSFDGVSTTWAKFCRRASNMNFKQHTRYRMTGIGTFEQVAATGEIAHVTLSEDSQTSQLTTKAAMLAITRQQIIDDDLSAFASAPRLLGRMAAIAVEKSVFTTLLANANSFFGVSNTNYISGGSSALSATSLDSALATLRKQTDANTDPVFIEPEVLLIPPDLEQTAKALVNSSLVVSGSTTAIPDGNPRFQLAEVVPASYLATSFGLSGSSATAWYLTTGANDFSIMEVAFLNGMETPTIETADMDFSKLGIQMRGYYDFGVALGEYRGGVKSAGA